MLNESKVVRSRDGPYYDDYEDNAYCGLNDTATFADKNNNNKNYGQDVQSEKFVFQLPPSPYLQNPDLHQRLLRKSPPQHPLNLGLTASSDARINLLTKKKSDRLFTDHNNNTTGSSSTQDDSRPVPVERVQFAKTTTIRFPQRPSPSVSVNTNDSTTTLMSHLRMSPQSAVSTSRSPGMIATRGGTVSMTGTAFDDHDATYVSEHHAFQAALLKSMVKLPNPRALTSTAASAIIGKPSTAPTKVENTVVLHDEKKDAYSPDPRTSPQVRESQQQHQNVTP